jgi:hypothetical protein
MSKTKCFACDKATSRPRLVRCIDEQTVFVGADCFRRIKYSGKDGYQPPFGGPKLYCISQIMLESADD